MFFRDSDASFCGSDGSVRYSPMNISPASNPKAANVTRHPATSPSTRPRGRPATSAIPPPATIALKAVALDLPGVTATAIGGAIDQKMEWAHATPIRDAISVQ